MKFTTALGCFLFLCLTLGCQKSSTLAPDTLENRVLVGKVTSGSGLFTGLETYEFTTQFDASRHFQSKTKSGSIESKGAYTYKKINKNSCVLILHPFSSIPAQELQITLKFTAPNTGVYEGHLLTGGQGEQTGLFDLK